MSAPSGTSERPAVYAGKEHSWAVHPLTRANRGLRALTPTILELSATILFHKSETGKNFYKWLNDNYTPFQINVWWTFGITSVLYWVIGLLFMAVDMTESPKMLYKYKLQPSQRITWKDYQKVCWIVLRNQIVVALPVTILVGLFAPFRTTTPLPGAWSTIGTYLFCLLCEETGFYYVHRYLHSAKQYKRFHKLHHEYTAPVALSSTYCTLTEHLLSNIMPILLGVMILRSHWSMMVMFFCGLEVGTLSTHSGYNLPFNFNALQHDWHHYLFTENFGPTGILDQVHGTNQVFKSWLGELSRRDAIAQAEGKPWKDVYETARKDVAARSASTN
ncbi:hypothetical protein DL93DRAFT_795090 [Clavulina sp. PMI_390]|nr:hypothetical protein DL93DRAFT_795090 [Clavulina sp. PMI_390]